MKQTTVSWLVLTQEVPPVHPSSRCSVRKGDGGEIMPHRCSGACSGSVLSQLPPTPQSRSHWQGSAAEHPAALPGREWPNLLGASTWLLHTASLGTGSGTQPTLPSSRSQEQL